MGNFKILKTSQKPLLRVYSTAKWVTSTAYFVIHRQVEEFRINDKVSIIKDQALLKKLQVGHGEWTDSMAVVRKWISEK